MQQVHDLLDQARQLYHQLRGTHAPDRAAQFDSGIDRAKMATDLTSAVIDPEQPSAPEPPGAEPPSNG